MPGGGLSGDTATGGTGSDEASAASEGDEPETASASTPDGTCFVRPTGESLAVVYDVGGFPFSLGASRDG